jgi:hypothetical protein
MKKGSMFRFYDETGQRIWETKDKDVDRLLEANDPDSKFCKSLEYLKRKMR